MRDRSSLPYLVERTNTRNMLYRVQTLESIPEHSGEDFEDEISRPIARDAREQDNNWKVLSTGTNLPKLVNKLGTIQRADTPSKLDQRGISSSKSSSFLNVANMPLSPREKAADKPKREDNIRSAKYLIYEPTVSDHVTSEIDLSRYAFRATLDRIPETDGERLLSAHGQRKSDSADKTKRNSGSTETSPQVSTTVSRGTKNKVSSLKSLDLYAQQRNQLVHKGPPTRVAFSYKMIRGDLHSQGLREPIAKSQNLSAEDVVFPRIVLYQWEVHHEQPKFINPFTPRKSRKKLHRIPTGQGPQANLPGDNERKDDINHDVIRPDSSGFKFPKAPPPTPKCESFKELFLIRSGSPEH